VKTRYKHIHFDDMGSEWSCLTNRDSDYLGEVSAGAWNQRTFKPIPGTEFSADCLRDIVDFIEQLAKEPR